MGTSRNGQIDKHNSKMAAVRHLEFQFGTRLNMGPFKR